MITEVSDFLFACKIGWGAMIATGKGTYVVLGRLSICFDIYYYKKLKTLLINILSR
jgi:hypothetical protein